MHHPKEKKNMAEVSEITPTGKEKKVESVRTRRVTSDLTAVFHHECIECGRAEAPGQASWLSGGHGQASQGAPNCEGCR
eukprot:1107645-Pelagomonas_calceolata.AAC.6